MILAAAGVVILAMTAFGVGSSVSGPPAPIYGPGPAPIAPFSLGQLPSRWKNPEPWAGQPPALMVATVATDPLGTTAYLAWFRVERTEVGLYPGSRTPAPSAAARGPESVPTTGRNRLIALFNGGFYPQDAPAGFFTHHTLYHPMINGLATLVTTTSGSVDVVAWRGGRHPSAKVAVARQNLQLLVDNGRATFPTNEPSLWGPTLHGAPAVWRSGVGVDAHGNLIYVAAPNQTAASLAQIFVHAHAIRAMELDINPAWPTLVLFRGPGARGLQLFDQNPSAWSTRYFSVGEKDFFGVYLRTRPGVATPPF